MLDLTYYLRGYAVSNTAMLVYGVLWGLSGASARQGKPYTYISRRSIAARVGKCERTARKAVKELESVGLISVKRMGRGLNDRIAVFSPSMPQDVKEKKVKATDPSNCRSRAATFATLITNKESVNNNNTDNLSVPIDDNAALRQKCGKGKPTNKRPHNNIDERRKIKKKYKEFLENSLKLNSLRSDLLSTGEEIESLEKIIELMSNTMASKGKIMINGTLLNPQQWWYVVKNISQTTILDLIYKIPRFKNVKNPRAYLLASIYNAAMDETLAKPWYNAAY